VKLLVCGGAGFIGSNFVRQRVNEHGDQVVVLDKLTYAGRPENLADLGDAVTLVHGPIEDPAKVAEAIGDGVDAIVNFAAESHVDRSISGPQAFVETNVRGTMILLEGARAREVPRYVQISTDEVYGSIEEGSFTEESPIVPSSPYSASKAGGDLLVQSYFHTYGLETVIARGSNNYGPYQYPEKLIPLMMLSALHDDNLLVYGDGLNVRNWLFVEDFGRGISHILAHGAPGEVYNVGGPTESTNLDVVQGILSHTGKDESLIKFIEDRQGHDRRYSLGSEKAKGLGWSAQVDFEEGLERTLAWYRDTPSWWQPIIDSAEFREYYERHYKRPLTWRAATSR
jgi:dTDP-glucose 4,6-dehydratase